MLNSKSTKGQSSAVELAIIIPVILTAIIAFTLLAPNYQYTAGSEVNTFQLNAMAQSLLQYIITNPGNPTNWGLNAANMTSFGLAEPGEPYHLDPFKVMELVYWELANYNQTSLAICYPNKTAVGFQEFLNQYGISALYNAFGWVLVPTTPTYWLLNYSEVKQMLGLGNDYDFELKLYPVFRVQVIPINGTQYATFLINVTNFNTGQPVPNATVYVQYIVASFTNNNETITIGNTTGLTDSNGIFNFTINVPTSSNNFYYIDAYATLGGLGDHGLYFNTTSNPLLVAMIVPALNSSTINWIIFAHPHVLFGCVPICNTGNNTGNGNGNNGNGNVALGLRIVGVYKSIYGYTFSTLNFTLGPGKGEGVSYPNASCQYLTTKQIGKKYSDCYWALPQTPMLLIVFVTRNSAGQACGLPQSQILVIPYGILSEYYLSNREIVFGKTVKYAPTATASAIVYIGDSAYVITLNLYYRGNVFGPMG